MSEETKISRRELFTRMSPLGVVSLDKARCTGCGLCALECATGALTITTEADGEFKIIFKHGLCTACGACRDICPEKCLTLTRGLKADELDHDTVLFSDGLVFCRQCGKPVGPRTMINQIRQKVEASGRSFTTEAELCPDCRARAQMGKLRLK
jgi:ferredoxin